MTIFSNQDHDPAVVQRVLDFLNAAQNPADISAISYLHDQLNLPNAYEIGEVVAQRILDKRKELPDAKFTNLDQLNDIKGFGPDKFDSLIQAFSGLIPSKARSFPTVDLFRFTTFRQPEKVVKPAIPFAYVQYAPAVTQTLKTEQVSNELPSPQALTEEFDSLWTFSHWLYENKASFHLEDLKKEVNLEVYKLDDATKVWTILLMEIRLQQDAFLRQACLELLVGHNFLTAYQQATQNKATDLLEDIEYWRRIAKATIILPKELFDGQQTIFNNQLKQGSGNATQNKQYSKIHQALIATENMQQQAALKEELTCLQPVYETSKEAAEQVDFNRYKEEIEPLEQELAETLESSIDQLDDLDEATLERLYRKANIPEFRFSFPNSLSKEFTEGKLSEAATVFITNNKLEDKEIITAINLLEQKEKISKKQLAGRHQKFVKEIFAYSTAVKPRIYHAFNFSSQEDLLAQEHFYFSFNAGYSNAHVKELKASLTIGETIKETQEIQLLSNESEVLLLELFSGFSTKKFNQSTATGQLNISLSLDNGEQFELEKMFHLRSPQTSGVLYPITDLHKEAQIKSTDLYGITQLGIADFRKVEQNLCCYVPGEVSHIENVMAREYKEKSTRNLVRSENTFETTTEKEVEELNDTTTTTRFEMNSEVANVINKDRGSNYGFNASVNGTAKLFGQEIGFNVGGYGDFSFATSSQNSNTTAKNYAEDVTRRALERIVQKTSTKRTSTMIKEFEQNHKHGYDNREGDQHVTGVYRWVDKIYKNRVVNYGKRLMYEFMLPEPARFFYETIYEKANDDNNAGGGDSGSGIDVPAKPTAPNISNHVDITRENYAQLAADYGANVDTPMNPTVEVSIPIAESIGGTDQAKTFSYQTLQIPTNYQCHFIELKVTFGYQAQRVWPFPYPECYFRASFAGKNWTYPSALEGAGTKSNVTKSYNLSPQQTGMIPVVLNTRRIKNYNGNVRALCQLDAQVYEQWQQMTYQAIMDAYNNQLQAYNAAVAAQQAANDAAAATANAVQDDEATNASHNSAMNLEIITTELKRLCIEMMTRPFGLPMGQGFYGSTCNDIPSLNLGPELDQYSAVVKFFEQAFDWQLMAYTFYAYYWSDKCTKWQDLLQRQNGTDYIFQRFIQSGMSRLVVPVREGFEKAVLYFMETGQVWNGLDVIVDMNNPLYLSILEELEKPTGDQVGEAWYTTVPSTLNIIQGRSAYLNETGLPCCGELEGEGGVNLLGSNEKLERLKE